MSAGLGKSAVLVAWCGPKHGTLHAVHMVCMDMVCNFTCCQPQTQPLSPPSQGTHHRPSLHQNPGGHNQIHCLSSGRTCKCHGPACARTHGDTRTHPAPSTPGRTQSPQQSHEALRAGYAHIQVPPQSSCSCASHAAPTPLGLDPPVRPLITEGCHGAPHPGSPTHSNTGPDPHPAALGPVPLLPRATVKGVPVGLAEMPCAYECSHTSATW